MLHDVAGTSVESALSFIVKTAYDLFKRLRDRDGDRQAFATYEPTLSTPCCMPAKLYCFQLVARLRKLHVHL